MIELTASFPAAFSTRSGQLMIVLCSHLTSRWLSPKRSWCNASSKVRSLSSQSSSAKYVDSFHLRIEFFPCHRLGPTF
jgi:hypothetical protein